MNAARTRGLLAPAALALALAGQYATEHAGALAIGLLLFAAGGAALVAARPREASLFADAPLEPAAPDPRSELAWPSRLRTALLAALPLLALSLFRSYGNPNDGLAWALHAASVIVFLIVLLRPAPAELMRRLRRAPAALSAAPRVEVAAMTLVLGMALALRTAALESLPFGLWYDEAVHGMSAVRMLEDGSYRPIFVPEANLASPFIALQAVSVEALGRSAAAVRLPSALLDVCFILLLYLLARRLMGWRIALLAAFLVAVSSWDITWGRSGMPGVTAPLAGVGATLAFLWALRRNDCVSFVLAGMALGSGFWLYQAVRTLPAALLLIAGFAIVTYRPPRRQVAMRAAAFAAGALLVAAPLLQYSVTHPVEFWSRAVIVASLNDGPSLDPLTSIAANLGDYLFMFNYSGDLNGRHNLPLEPMLSFGAGAMAVLGFVYCLTLAYRPVPFLLLSLFFAALLPGLVTLPQEAPNSLRVVGALPIVYAFAGVGIAAVMVATAPLLRGPRLAAFALGAPLALGLAAIAYDNFHTYFHMYRDDLTAWAAFYPEQTEVAHRLQALPSADYDVILSPYLPYYPVISYLVDDPPRIETFSPALHPPASGGGDGALIFLDSREEPFIPLLEDFYPGRSFSQVDFGRGPKQPILYAMELDAPDVYGPQGVTLRTSSPASGRQADTEGVVGRIDLPWGEFDGRLPVTAEWAGSLYVSEYRSYTFTLEGSPDAALRLDGAEVMRGPGQTEVTLAVGLHSLRLRDTAQDTQGRTRLAWDNPEGAQVVVSTPDLYVDERARGLLATYLPPGFPENADGAFQQIEPMVFAFYHDRPFLGEFSVSWDGGLRIDEAGEYGFRLDSSGHATLSIDGAVVVDNPGLAEESGAPFVSADGVVTLAPGVHPIRVTFTHKLGEPQIFMHWWSGQDEAAAVPLAWERLVPAPPMPPN